MFEQPSATANACKRTINPSVCQAREPCIVRTALLTGGRLTVTTRLLHCCWLCWLAKGGVRREGPRAALSAAGRALGPMKPDDALERCDVTTVTKGCGRTCCEALLRSPAGSTVEKTTFLRAPGHAKPTANTLRRANEPGSPTEHQLAECKSHPSGRWSPQGDVALRRRCNHTHLLLGRFVSFKRPICTAYRASAATG